MKTILVSLISDQTIPNILVAAHYKPDIFWFISTLKMEEERKAECIENTLRLKGLMTQDDHIPTEIVDQDSLIDCISKIEALVEKMKGEVQYIVNITGGNKVMALAAYDIFRGIGEKVVIGYIPIGRNEFVQMFPRKKTIKTSAIPERLNLEEYLSSYGFSIVNKDKLDTTKYAATLRKDMSTWILSNYEQLKGLLGFLYIGLMDGRDKKRYGFSSAFNREPSAVEKEMLKRHGFVLNGRLISKDLTKEEMVYLTGGWFEEYIFNEVFDLVQDNILDDAFMDIIIESLSGVPNQLDIAFVKDNVFYYIECKTLGEGNKEKNIVSEEIYKKGAISTLLGKGEKRAFICTTQNKINESNVIRGQAYGIEILSLNDVRDLTCRLKQRFGNRTFEG